MSFFREGNDDAFRVIHDRYRARLCAYTRQMLAGTSQEPEDVVQEIFLRSYYALRTSTGPLALRAWLYRIAHNRCIDELRRPHLTAVEAIDALVPNVQDPVTKVEQRDALRRLIADVQRLPDQQRSALLMRELSGMAYADVSGALGVSVPAVKSLLVRARVSLAQASEARDTACTSIREDLILSHDRGVRTSGLARRHMRDCSDCRRFRSEVRGVNRSLAALAPTLGPLGVIANLLGLGGGGGGAAAGGVAGGGAASGGAAAAAGGTGAVASTGLLATGATHVVTLLAAAVVATGGAVELQRTLSATHHHSHRHAAAVAPRRASAGASAAAASTGTPAATTASTGGVAPAASSPSSGSSGSAGAKTSAAVRRVRGDSTGKVPITETLDPDNLLYASSLNPTGSAGSSPGSLSTTGTGTATGAPAGGSTATGTTGTTAPGSTAATGSGITGPGATGTSGPTATGTTGSGTTTTTGTGSSSTATGTGASPTAGGAASTSGSSAQSPGGTTNGSGTAATTSSTPSTGASSSSSSAASNSVSSSAASTKSSKVLNFVTTKRHHPHRRVLVGRLL